TSLPLLLRHQPGVTAGTVANRFTQWVGSVAHEHLVEGDGWRESNRRRLGAGVGRVGRACYSITSLAWRSSDCGIVKPSALAVLRLMTSSNLVGCSTGRSAGFAPLRIWSAYRAACLKISGRLGAYARRQPSLAYSASSKTPGSRCVNDNSAMCLRSL